MAVKTSIHDTAVSLYRELQRAMVANDTASMARILTNDCHLLHMTGYNQPKTEWLNHMDTGRMRYFKTVEHDVRVQVGRDDKVVVIGQNKVDANIWGARGSWPLQLTLQFQVDGDELLISNIVATTY